MPLVGIIQEPEDPQQQDQEDEAGLSRLEPEPRLYWPQAKQQH